VSGLLNGEEVVSTDILVVRVSPDGLISNTDVVIDGSDLPCSDVTAAVDGNGKVHVIAACGPFLSDRLVYATDASGSWTSQTLSLSGATIEISPRLVADGGDLHLVFRGDVDCEAGKCGEIFYAKGSGGAFGPAVSISGSKEVRDYNPAIGVDAFHRPVMAWEVKQENNHSDMFMSYCAQEGSFSAPLNLTPDAEALYRDDPSHISFRPGSGLPVISFNRTVRGSDPLNVEIYSAEIPQEAID
jgi:hypothetical protein